MGSKRTIRIIKPLNLKNAGNYYLSQGFNRRGESSNDCGPTSAAMVLNVLNHARQGKPKPVTKEKVIRAFPVLGRLPGWMPAVGGASAPWGLTAAFNKVADRLRLGWEAQRMRNATLQDIVENLKLGNQVSMLRFWKEGGAHWSNVVKILPAKDQIFMLDPSPYLADKHGSKKIQLVSWRECRQDWERRPWYARLLRLQKELVIYKRKV